MSKFDNVCIETNHRKFVDVDRFNNVDKRCLRKIRICEKLSIFIVENICEKLQILVVKNV